ncbi:MAG: ABC transporter transmembrane domain-containing protein [Coleofasciculaceae cyanobacterium]
MANSRLQTLFTYLRPHWRPATLGILALLIVNGLGVYIPLLIRDSIGELRVALSFDQIGRFVLLIFLLASLMWLIRIVSRILLFGIGRQVEFDLKQKIFQHLLKMEPSYFAKNTAGDLINRATSDVDNIRRLLGFSVLSLANILFAYGLTLPVMMSISVRLTLIALVVYPFMLITVYLFSNRLRNQQLAVQEKLSNLSELIQEDMSGIYLIKIYAQEENERRAFGRLNKQLLKANLNLARTRNTLFPVIEALASISLLILLFVGPGVISAGEINIGDFVALILFAERLVFPTALLGFTITAYQRGEVSIDRVESIFLNEPQIQDTTDASILPQPIKGQIKAVNLSYTYPGATTPALKNINFTINPGERVAIVGAIGSGKSTLANTLPHLLDISENQLFLDGHDITKVSLQDLRKAIAYVPQESFLFSASIKNNIRYGDPVSEQSEVESAAKQAQIHPEILNFPQQYETMVGERGITLSGGQRQRTSLGRALLIDAPILILDDALASVDNRTATQILENLSEGTQRKTVLFISHQLSAAATADRIFVMDAGQIVQTGTHTELIQNPGLYQSLWNQHQREEQLEQPLSIIDFLRQVKYFQNFSEVELLQLATIGYRKCLQKSGILFREQDPGDALYIVLSGSVEVFVAELNKHLCVLQTGDFLGELSLMLGIPRTATVQALEETVLFAIDKNGLRTLLQERPELYEVIAQELGKHQEELVERQQELRELGLLDEEEDDHNPLTWVRKRLKKLFSI